MSCFEAAKSLLFLDVGVHLWMFVKSLASGLVKMYKHVFPVGLLGTSINSPLQERNMQEHLYRGCAAAAGLVIFFDCNNKIDHSQLVYIMSSSKIALGLLPS